MSILERFWSYPRISIATHHRRCMLLLINKTNFQYNHNKRFLIENSWHCVASAAAIGPFGRQWNYEMSPKIARSSSSSHVTYKENLLHFSTKWQQLLLLCYLPSYNQLQNFQYTIQIANRTPGNRLVTNFVNKILQKRAARPEENENTERQQKSESKIKNKNIKKNKKNDKSNEKSINAH